MEIILTIPAYLENELRERAAAEHRSVDLVTLDAVKRGLAVPPATSKKRDLSDLAGRRTMDAETLAALDEQRQIDPELWK